MFQDLLSTFSQYHFSFPNTPSKFGNLRVLSELLLNSAGIT